MKHSFFSGCLAGLLSSWSLLTVSTVMAADDIRSERVHFTQGANSAVIEGSIKGYEVVDYVLDARSGQYLNVSLATQHGATYFNILAPGENEVAMFNGSISLNQYEGTLAASGDYKVRVYMMRSAARRNEVAHYRLEMIIDDAVQPAAGATAHDAWVPGTGFHATGQIPCSIGKGQPAGSCAFGVKRQGGGSALVTVTRVNGGQRVIIFDKSVALGYHQGQADAAEFRAMKEGDLNIIYIGEERYDIPDAVVHGG